MKYNTIKLVIIYFSLVEKIILEAIIYKIRKKTKVLIILLLLMFQSTILNSQPIIEQGFDNGTNLSDEWEIKVGGTYTSALNCGKSIPSIKFTASNQYIITPFFRSATDLSFWIKGNSVDSISYLVISWNDSTNWHFLDTLRPIPNVATIVKYEIPTSEICQLKFEYFKSAGNVAFDDLIISKPTPPVHLIENNIQIINIKDYSATFKLNPQGNGYIVYALFPESGNVPTINEMLNLSAYAQHSTIIDSGLLAVKNSEPITMILNSLQPETSYNLYLLPTGSKKNISDTSRIISMHFKTQSGLPDLFFSAIIKGTGNNKAIEIVNPGSDTINLSCYRIAQSTNGGGWTTSYFYFKPNTFILPHSSFLIMKNTADSNLIQLFKPDTLTSSRILTFTGNDARALQRSVNNGNSWFTIDVYGLPNQSNNFSVAGIINAAANYNLIRKPAIKKGNMDWNISAGVDSLSSEWLLTPLTDYSILRLKRSFSNQLRLTSIWFETQIKVPVIDTLKQYIYVVLNQSTNLKQIKWKCATSEGVKVFPDPEKLTDFSANTKIFLIDTATSDTTKWIVIFTFGSKETDNSENNSNHIDMESSLIKVYIQNHKLIIENSSNQKIDKVLVNDVTGKSIYKIFDYTKPIYLGNLKNGIYMIRIYLSNNQIIATKIVKIE